MWCYTAFFWSMIILEVATTCVMCRIHVEMDTPTVQRRIFPECVYSGRVSFGAFRSALFAVFEDIPLLILTIEIAKITAAGYEAGFKVAAGEEYSAKEGDLEIDGFDTDMVLSIIAGVLGLIFKLVTGCIYFCQSEPAAQRVQNTDTVVATVIGLADIVAIPIQA